MKFPEAKIESAIIELLGDEGYPQTGEVVNVAVVVNCLQACLLHFQAEEQMPNRVKALFPGYDAVAFAAAVRRSQSQITDIRLSQNPERAKPQS